LIEVQRWNRTMSNFARRVRDFLHMALSARANRYWMDDATRCDSPAERWVET
jgi:hypothetical protein